MPWPSPVRGGQQRTAAAAASSGIKVLNAATKPAPVRIGARGTWSDDAPDADGNNGQDGCTEAANHTLPPDRHLFDLANTVADLKHQLQHATCRAAAAEAESRDLQRKMELGNRTRNISQKLAVQHEEAAAAAKARCDALLAENEQLHRTIERVQRRGDQAMRAISSKQAELDSAKARADEARAEQRKAKAEAESAAVAVAAAQQLQAAAEDEVSHLSADLAAAQEKTQELQGQLSQQAGHGSRLSADLAAAQEKTQELQRQLSEQAGHGSRLSADLAAAQEKTQELQRQLREQAAQVRTTLLHQVLPMLEGLSAKPQTEPGMFGNTWLSALVDRLRGRQLIDQAGAASFLVERPNVGGASRRSSRSSSLGSRRPRLLQQSAVPQNNGRPCGLAAMTAGTSATSRRRAIASITQGEETAKPGKYLETVLAASRRAVHNLLVDLLRSHEL